jgi:hypothetical protein
MTDDTRGAEVDPHRTADLRARWRAAVCVTATGVESYWLLAPDPQGAPGCACPLCAPHEQEGPWTMPHTTSGGSA